MKLSVLGDGTALILALGAISGDQEATDTIKRLLATDETDPPSAD